MAQEGVNLKSEFSPGESEFQRYFVLSSTLDEMSAQVGIGNFQALIPFWSILWTLYKDMNALLTKETQDQYKVKFREMRKRIYAELNAAGDGEYQMPVQLQDDLDDLQMDVLSLKQSAGLGIIGKKEISLHKKLEQGLGME